MEEQKNELYALDLFKRHLYVGTTVLPTDAETSRYAQVTLIAERSVTATYPSGEQIRRMAENLIFCRRPTNQVDERGVRLLLDDKVMITAYGGRIAQTDVGGKGHILKLGKFSAKVRFMSDYEKEKNIPYELLLKI